MKKNKDADLSEPANQILDHVADRQHNDHDPAHNIHHARQTLRAIAGLDSNLHLQEIEAGSNVRKFSTGGKRIEAIETCVALSATDSEGNPITQILVLRDPKVVQRKGGNFGTVYYPGKAPEEAINAIKFKKADGSERHAILDFIGSFLRGGKKSNH